MNLFDTTTGLCRDVTPKTPGRCTQVLDGDHFFVRKCGPFFEVMRQSWRMGKLTATQPMCYFDSENEADDVARKLTERTN